MTTQGEITKKDQSKFETLEEHPSFSKNEEQIILFWGEIRAFETQLEKAKDCPVYIHFMIDHHLNRDAPLWVFNLRRT